MIQQMTFPFLLKSPAELVLEDGVVKGKVVTNVVIL